MLLTFASVFEIIVNWDQSLVFYIAIIHEFIIRIDKNKTQFKAASQALYTIVTYKSRIMEARQTKKQKKETQRQREIEREREHRDIVPDYEHVGEGMDYVLWQACWWRIADPLSLFLDLRLKFPWRTFHWRYSEWDEKQKGAKKKKKQVREASDWAYEASDWIFEDWIWQRRSKTAMGMGMAEPNETLTASQRAERGQKWK